MTMNTYNPLLIKLSLNECFSWILYTWSLRSERFPIVRKSGNKRDFRKKSDRKMTKYVIAGKAKVIPGWVVDPDDLPIEIAFKCPMCGDLRYGVHY
jgi:hypothetical protein